MIIPNIWEIENVPNHQPARIMSFTKSSQTQRMMTALSRDSWRAKEKNGPLSSQNHHNLPRKGLQRILEALFYLFQLLARPQQFHPAQLWREYQIQSFTKQYNLNYIYIYISFYVDSMQIYANDVNVALFSCQAHRISYLSLLCKPQAVALQPAARPQKTATSMTLWDKSAVEVRPLKSVHSERHGQSA